MQELVQISTVIVFPGRVPPIDRNQCNLPNLAEHHSTTYTGGSVTLVAPMCRQVTQMSIGGVLRRSRRPRLEQAESFNDDCQCPKQRRGHGQCHGQAGRGSRMWIHSWRRGSPRSQPPRRTAVHWPAHWPPEVVQFPAPRPSVSRPRPSAH